MDHNSVGPPGLLCILIQFTFSRKHGDCIQSQLAASMCFRFYVNLPEAVQVRSPPEDDEDLAAKSPVIYHAITVVQQLHRHV